MSGNHTIHFWLRIQVPQGSVTQYNRRSTPPCLRLDNFSADCGKEWVDPKRLWLIGPRWQSCMHLLGKHYSSVWQHRCWPGCSGRFLPFLSIRVLKVILSARDSSDEPLPGLKGQNLSWRACTSSQNQCWRKTRSQYFEGVFHQTPRKACLLN
jgi:hypothetical protein